MNIINDTVWQSDELVRHYLTGVRGSIPLASEQINVMLRLIGSIEGPIHNFMDLGCGDGVLAAAILARYPEAEATLVDFSAPMLQAAQERFAGKKYKVKFVSLDYGDPSWKLHLKEAETFDAIVSGFSIHHQPDARKKTLYRELFGLLKPGGIFINLEHVASASPLGTNLFDEHFIDSMQAYAVRAQSGKTREQVSSEYYNRPDKASNILAPVETQCEWLREIGFTDVDCFLKIFELAVFAGVRPLQP